MHLLLVFDVIPHGITIKFFHFICMIDKHFWIRGIQRLPFFRSISLIAISTRWIKMSIENMKYYIKIITFSVTSSYLLFHLTNSDYIFFCFGQLRILFRFRIAKMFQWNDEKNEKKSQTHMHNNNFLIVESLKFRMS